MTVKKKITIVIGVDILSFFIILCAAFAKEPRGPKDIIERIQSKYESTITIEADFTQESFISSLGQTQKATGRVYIKKPGLMRWEYKEPEKQLILTNKRDVIIYIPEDNQVIKDKAENIFSSSVPAAFLAGRAKLTDNFAITMAKEAENEKTYRLILVPKIQQPTLVKMLLSVDKNSFQITGSKIYDVYENATSIKFINIKTNKKLSDRLFDFEIPKGAEVISKPDFR